MSTKKSASKKNIKVKKQKTLTKKRPPKKVVTDTLPETDPMAAATAATLAATDLMAAVAKATTAAADLMAAAMEVASRASLMRPMAAAFPPQIAALAAAAAPAGGGGGGAPATSVPQGVTNAMKRCTDRRPITLSRTLNWHFINQGPQRNNLAVELFVEFPTMTCSVVTLAQELNSDADLTGDGVCDIVEKYLP